MEKTKGQIAYEADVKRIPVYHDGSPRKQWSELSDFARSSWERPKKGEIAMDDKVRDPAAPAKGEQAQIDSLYRQLRRLQESADNLSRRMAINGRMSKYYSPVSSVSTSLGQLADQIKPITSEK